MPISFLFFAPCYRLIVTTFIANLSTVSEQWMYTSTVKLFHAFLISGYQSKCSRINAVLISNNSNYCSAIKVCRNGTCRHDQIVSLYHCLHSLILLLKIEWILLLVTLHCIKARCRTHSIFSNIPTRIYNCLSSAIVNG